MPTYVSLLNFTEDGIESIDELAQRDADGKSLLASVGVDLHEHYYLLGQYDELIVYEAPDDETAAQAMLAVASEGNITTETLRAFSEADFHGIVDELPD